MRILLRIHPAYKPKNDEDSVKNPSSIQTKE